MRSYWWNGDEVKFNATTRLLGFGRTPKLAESEEGYTGSTQWNHSLENISSPVRANSWQAAKGKAGRKPIDVIVMFKSVHDSQVLGQLLDEDNESDTTWADSAYRSDAIEDTLGLIGFESQIHERGYRNELLTELVGDRATWQSQEPMVTPTNSEPEPDFVIVRMRIITTCLLIPVQLMCCSWLRLRIPLWDMTKKLNYPFMLKLVSLIIGYST